MKIRLLFLSTIFTLLFANEPEQQVPAQNLYSHVSFLTSTPDYRNHMNLESLNMAANYIDSVFSGYSNRVEKQTFNIDGKDYQNIICSFGPENGERIIVGAHYDVCYNQPGADDNASGIAGLLELARLISENQSLLTKRIDLVAYTLEEPPNFRKNTMGSFIHANSLRNAGIQVELMICLDMIGYFDDTPDSQRFPLNILSFFYPDEGNFISVISNFNNFFKGSKVKRLMMKNSDIKVTHLSGPSMIQGIDFSDHLNFWNSGYNAVFITDTAFYRNPNYHKKSDTIDTLDFDRMSEVVNGLYGVVILY